MRARPRIWRTAGGRGWARIPGEPYDPTTDPTSVQNILREEPPAMPRNPSRESIELVGRAEKQGARTRRTKDGKTMIYPPNGSTPVTVAPRFDCRSDYHNAISRLQKAGIDVSDPQANGRPANPVMTPADVAKLQTNGTRPTLQYDRPAAKDADGSKVGSLVPAKNEVRDIEDMLEMIEGLDARLGRQSQIMQLLEGHIHELQESNQKLVRRVEFLERTARAEGGAESRAAKYERIGGLVMDLLRRMPASIPLSSTQIAEGAALAEEDRGSPLRTSINRLVESGQVVPHGKGSGTTYAIAPGE